MVAKSRFLIVNRLGFLARLRERNGRQITFLHRESPRVLCFPV